MEAEGGDEDLESRPVEGRREHPERHQQRQHRHEVHFVNTIFEQKSGGG